MVFLYLGKLWRFLTGIVPMAKYGQSAQKKQYRFFVLLF